MLHEAHERSPRTALTPIPEAPECSDKPDLESGPSPSERRGSDLSDAMAPRPIVSTADERAERAAKRAAVERELPAWRSVREFPAHREAFGRLTLRASDDPQAEGVRAGAAYAMARSHFAWSSGPRRTNGQRRWWPRCRWRRSQWVCGEGAPTCSQLPPSTRAICSTRSTASATTRPGAIGGLRSSVGWVLPSLTCEIETVLRSAPCVVEDSANQHE